MQRVLAATTVALSLALTAPGAATASHQGNGGPPRDFAVGGGFTGSESNDPMGAQHVGFAAHGGPTTLTGFGGDPVTGHFRAGGEFLDPPGGNNEVGEFQQVGPVTCLVVERDPVVPDRTRARLVYPIRQGTPEANEVNEVLIFLEDNGNPRGGQPRDRIGFAVIPDETPDDDPPSEQDQECVAPVESPAMSTLTKGNFTIHDAP
jgi:hypothetical protein